MSPLCAIIGHMNRQRQNAIAALAAAGVLWGLTVPLSKLSLGWLSPAWLTAARFAVAALVLGWIARRDLRQALTPRVVATGAVGFGGVIMLQNVGIERTSVSHAAVLIGAAPLLVAVLTAAGGRSRLVPRRWAGNFLALAGVVLLAGIGPGGSMIGDALVFASSGLSAAFVVLQPRVLADRDAKAVTAVQFAGAAAVALPVALLMGTVPAAPGSAAPVIGVAALALLGTVLPFSLFAAGQVRVRPDVAAAYLNLEPVVGAAVGWFGFGDHAGLAQIAGVIIVLSGLALNSRTPAEGSSRRATPRAVVKSCATEG